MNAADYNADRIIRRELTAEHITELVRLWQIAHALEVDGKAGPKTIASIMATLRPSPFLASPLPTLPDGRKALITSEFKTRNPSRPTHNGVDYFYHWRKGDKPDRTGNGGAAGQTAEGTPKWVIPDGTLAIAAAAGLVLRAEVTRTGHMCWIDHGNGLRTGYFHLADLRVKTGQRVETGTPLGLVGDNPIDGDARHLHFELSPSDRYEPIDPTPYLAD